jgi:ribosomal protein S18 acetylase RimI-like enzyme
MNIEQLDNPAWWALHTVDKHFNIGNEVVKYFPANISPFVGIENWDEKHQLELLHNLPADRSFAVMVAESFELIDGLETVFTTTLNQLVFENFKTEFSTEMFQSIQPLGDEYIKEMLELTALTKPGPFYEKTNAFGNYVGIFQDNQVVAMAGERLHLNDYTEISAVCTHPSQTGKGFGSLLVAYLVEKIIESGQTPFLHARKDNVGAIRVYEKVGFVVRKEMNFAIFKKKNPTV